MLTKDAQAYIACFKTLVQLPLAMLALRALQARHFRVVLPNNTAAESGINRLPTTTELISGFLKLVAAWSTRNHVQLADSHLASEKKFGRDECSHNKMHRMAARMAGRERIFLATFSSPEWRVTLRVATRTSRRLALRIASNSKQMRNSRLPLWDS